MIILVMLAGLVAAVPLPSEDPSASQKDLPVEAREVLDLTVHQVSFTRFYHENLTRLQYLILHFLRFHSWMLMKPFQRLKLRLTLQPNRRYLAAIMSHR